MMLFWRFGMYRCSPYSPCSAFNSIPPSPRGFSQLRLLSKRLPLQQITSRVEQPGHANFRLVGPGFLVQPHLPFSLRLRHRPPFLIRVHGRACSMLVCLVDIEMVMANVILRSKGWTHLQEYRSPDADAPIACQMREWYYLRSPFRARRGASTP
jgi:hypothetical protein